MKQLFYILILAIAALCACSSRPKIVLSRGEMERVLYDYHIMQAIIEQLPDSERYDKAQDYINAVFEKYNITEAQFDSSVAYYNRNTKDLAKIYNNLKARFQKETEAIQLQTGDNDLAAMFAEGDTANIWAGAKMVLLRGNDLMRTESFSILCDTTCHQRDQFTLMFTPLFLANRNVGSNGLSLTAGLSIVYENGKTVGVTQQVSYSNPQRLMLKANDSVDIAKVNIFFYYKGNDDAREACIINGISLVQMHEKAGSDTEAEQETDTVSTITETPQFEAVPAQEMRSFTAEEVRLENKSDQTIHIQTAPAVRRPNSIGPRRKQNKTKQGIWQ